MKIGIAFAGGGIKGAAHIGVLKALEENGIEVGYIGGTSIGSMAAALYAMGYTPSEMYKLFKYYSKSLMDFDLKYLLLDGREKNKILAEGLMSGENIEKAIKDCAEYKKIKNVKDLKMPIVIPTVDIIENKKYVFTNHEFNKKFSEKDYINNAPIWTAVRASASYPGMYAPTKFKHHKFVDGGIIDNLPVEEVKKLGAKKVLAVNFGSESSVNPKSFVEVVSKSIDLMFEQRTQRQVDEADFTLELDMPDASVFSVRKFDYCYKIGYDAANREMKKLKKIFKD